MKTPITVAASSGMTWVSGSTSGVYPATGNQELLAKIQRYRESCEDVFRELVEVPTRPPLRQAMKMRQAAQ